MRRANIGLYTDRMVLSVQESVQEGSYCLLRRQVQEDFLNEQGSLDVDKTVQAAEGLAQLAQQLFCSSTTLWGYGVLRYEEGCRQRLEQRLPAGMQLRAACGGRQARAAASVLQVQSRQPITIGAHSGDLSTQIFFPGQQADAMEWYSVPLGWRVLWERCSKLVGARTEQENLCQLAVQILRKGAVGRPAGEERLCVGGLDSLRRFALCVSANKSSRQEVTLDRELLFELGRLLRNPSLHWLSALHAADEVFPQRVFYQMVLLEALLEQVGAKQAALYKVCIEDEIARETDGVQEERKADSNRQLLG